MTLEPPADGLVRSRARELLERHRLEVWRRNDRVFTYLMPAQWIAGIVLALAYSPRVWAGTTSQIHIHVWAAIFLGGAISAPPVLLTILQPGRASTRYAVAVGQMLTSALLIHISGGRIETHFHIFGSLAFLAFYRDWRVLAIATVTIAADHFVRGVVMPESIYGVAYSSAWRAFEHALWVAFEDIVLLVWCRSGLAEMRQIATRQAELEESQRRVAINQRLEKEMEIASKIQTAVLPRKFKVDGLQIAAQMIPASEVGGDYYEILPVKGGCWIGIGDVSGHGLTSGLIMLMIQSAVAGLGRHSPDSPPRELLRVLNEMLFENIRVRLLDDNHATLSLLRYHDDGRIVFSGAHEEIVVCRADGKCELIDTPGPWIGAMRNIERSAVDTSMQLREGEVMLLYTDGLTEAMNVQGEQFGLERLCNALEGVCERSVEEIRDHLIDTVRSWTAIQADDLTLVVVRQCGLAGSIKAAA